MNPNRRGKSSFVEYQIYKYQVIRELNGIHTLLRFFSGKPRLVHFSGVQEAIKEGFNDSKSILATALCCSTVIIERTISKLSPSDRERLISELPTLEMDFLIKFHNAVYDASRPAIIQLLAPRKSRLAELPYPKDKLPGTLMIGAVIANVGAFSMHKAISIEERNQAMEQIYGSLHGIPENQRHGLDFQSILPAA